MTQKPLVSIVIPLYNGSNYVEEALKSAFAQTYPNIEVIVVNDGSTDDGASRAICEKYIDKISYYEKENGGCASALNYGIKRAKGDFISWLSHDDLYKPTKVEKQIEAYNRHSLSVDNTIISNVGMLVDSNGEKIPHPTRKTTGFLSSSKAFKYILTKSCPNGCGLMIPKSLFERFGYFDEGMRFVLDWNLWLKFAFFGVDFYFDDEILVSNRVHSMQVTVKQKELHSKEADMTVDQLLCIMQESNADEEHWKLLYRFSYACERGDSKEILSCLKEREIRISKCKFVAFKIKTKIKRFAKAVYRKIR